METVYFIFAAVGVALWVLQFLFGFLGDMDHGDVSAGDAHDMHADATGHDSAHAWVWGLFSIRGMLAAMTFFGLGGLAAHYSSAGTYPSLAVALAAGLAGLLVIAGLLRLMAKATADGTLRIQNAVGQVGTVYLRIPGHSQGKGKVSAKVQEQLVEFQAITTGDELPTGAQVVIVNVVGPDTVEVIPAIC